MEFSEVMKQAQRICMIYSDNYCQHCPLCDENENCEMGAFSEKSFDAQALESAIMGWAKENPEPVYPSWEKAWKILFPNAKRTPCPNLHFGCECIYEGCPNCAMQPMPAEIAKKLGIKPIVKEWEQ